MPPAASIRARSRGLFGLWSKLSGTALPLRLSTARLSPALATMTCRSVTQATQAVQPMLSGSARPFPKDCNSGTLFAVSWSNSSILWKVLMRAAAMSFSLCPSFPTSTGKEHNSLVKCLSTNFATCSPPWPSKTANNAKPRHPAVHAADGRRPTSLSKRRAGVVMCASSMPSRQPCMQLDAHERCKPPSTAPQSESLTVIGFSNAPPIATALDATARRGSLP
mmetsp:Transcript_17291/g.49477  ORF Transcript_17291/g.49477 Transcript_17291/m.49477 type:complete len:222 (+) Transcript_17291:701-1366(+)